MSILHQFSCKECLLSGILATVLLWAASLSPPALAETDIVGSPETVIAMEEEEPADARVATRINDIFSEVEGLKKVDVSVIHGVVTLRGEVPNESTATKALKLVSRVEGVVAVEDSVQRTLDLTDNVAPMLESVKGKITGWIRALPLFLAALCIFLAVAFVGNLLARRTAIWSRLTPNLFLAQILAQAVRIASILIGLVLTLNLLDATALMGTILGSAGVVGLAISFGVKDSIENYISSIMLSIRQPFRAEDHVVIDDMEGIVVRLTSRSTIIMTLDGNHLRIPNATVYKSPILNYTLNPQRRFNFVLGVDADDDPAEAMNVGVEVMRELEWVLDDPAPYALIETVGDSSIVLKFMGWVDQRVSDFGKSRSLSIRATKNALEERGFTLPEPIYRLRFDGRSLSQLSEAGIQSSNVESKRDRPTETSSAESSDGNQTPGSNPVAAEIVDVEPETHVSDKVREERIASGEEDLLDDSRPME